MFLTYEKWKIEDSVASRLAAPFQPWKCVAMTSSSPIFIVELKTGVGAEGFRFVMASGVDMLLNISATPGTRIASVCHLLLLATEVAPVLEVVIEIRRITPHWLPPQHTYKRSDGTWSLLEPWPPGEVLPQEKQISVFSMFYG